MQFSQSVLSSGIKMLVVARLNHLLHYSQRADEIVRHVGESRRRQFIIPVVCQDCAYVSPKPVISKSIFRILLVLIDTRKNRFAIRKQT